MLAENRVGELLALLARATPTEAGQSGGHAKAATSDDATKQPSPYAEALTTNGFSRQTSYRYQVLAPLKSAVLRWWMEPDKSRRRLSKPRHALLESLGQGEPAYPLGCVNRLWHLFEWL
jgi:hypothetical protein